MTQIKSEKAKEYIESQFTSEYNDIEHYLCHYGEDGVVLEKGRIGRCRRCADKAVIIAETEAEERHAKELQELKDKAVESCCYACTISGAGCSHREREDTYQCDLLKDFTAKLNEK